MLLLMSTSLFAQHAKIKPFESVNVISLEAGNSIYVDVNDQYYNKLPDYIFAVDDSGGTYKSSRLKAGQYLFDELADNLTVTVFYNDPSGTTSGRSTEEYLEHYQICDQIIGLA